MCILQKTGEIPHPSSYLLPPGICTADIPWYNGLHKTPSTSLSMDKRKLISWEGFWEWNIRNLARSEGAHSLCRRAPAFKQQSPQTQGFTTCPPHDMCRLTSTQEQGDSASGNQEGVKTAGRRRSNPWVSVPLVEEGLFSSERQAHLYKQTDQNIT
jgi:hypothetical protein